MSHEPAIVPDWAELPHDPEDADLAELTASLAKLDGPADEAGVWPADVWAELVDYGVPLWALPTKVGGQECERLRLLQRYARVAEGSMTAAFILSQHDAGVRRLAVALDRHGATTWLKMIKADEAFATVGISQLTTSKRLGANPLRAVPDGHGYRLNGAMPWVTAAEMADVIVTGAVLDDGRQILVALPTDRPGLDVREPFLLAALQASCTSEVVCDRVHIEETFLLAGPDLDVMSHAGAGGTGGLETSALALGQARAALVAIEGVRGDGRAELADSVEALCDSWRYTWQALAAASQGGVDAPTPAQVRGQSNALVLRTTQAYLTARRGSGFLRTEPAQRWARQALFFLVWSCPGPVADATIRDLAGVCAL